MATDNAKRIAWSDLILSALDKQHVFAGLANRRYEGDARLGKAVKIIEVGDISTAAYTGADFTFTDLEDAGLTLLIDQAQAIYKQYDDISKIQDVPGLWEEAARKIAQAIAENVDSYIGGLYGDAGVVSGTTGSPVSITSANVFEKLADMGTSLSVNNVPKAGRVAVVPPWLAQKILMSKVAKDTDNSNALGNGFVGNFAGFEVYESNNISASGTTWYAPMFFVKGESIALAQQIESIEFGRREANFKDFIKALSVYGAKVIRPKATGVLYCAAGSES
jgi:hypothetical protein